MECIRVDTKFPDSTLRGNAELGDNNQVQVALDTFLARENNRREAVVKWVNSLRLKSSVYFSGCTVYGLSIRYGLGLREME